MQKNSDLKPCPFCGVLPAVDHWFNTKKMMYQVRCMNDKCRIKPWTDYHCARSVVVREWNRRANDEKG